MPYLSLPPNYSLDTPTFPLAAHDPDDLIDDSITRMLRAADEAAIASEHAAALEAEAEAEDDQVVYQVAVVAAMQSPSPFSGLEDTPGTWQLLPDQDIFDSARLSALLVTAPAPLLPQPLASIAITQITPTSKCPTITTQLSATWMRDYDCTQSAPVKKGLLHVKPAI
ncbi:hypothetical protein L208DRAFT_1382503 [Tricholoma matsutake]|nr:hypothetical protein L208DRAFT_1382503 [Tricholoma matsutake 945]